MLIGTAISILFGLNIGQSVMALTLVTVPLAIKMEQSIHLAKGHDYTNGSPVGNVLAKVLGAIFVSGSLWLFGYMLVNIIRLETS